MEHYADEMTEMTDKQRKVLEDALKKMHEPSMRRELEETKIDVQERLRVAARRSWANMKHIIRQFRE